MLKSASLDNHHLTMDPGFGIIMDMKSSLVSHVDMTCESGVAGFDCKAVLVVHSISVGCKIARYIHVCILATCIETVVFSQKQQGVEYVNVIYRIAV